MKNESALKSDEKLLVSIDARPSTAAASTIDVELTVRLSKLGRIKRAECETSPARCRGVELLSSEPDFGLMRCLCGGSRRPLEARDSAGLTVKPS